MKKWLRYWPEFLILAVMSGILVLLVSPDATWTMMAADGPAYVMSAKYLYPAHHTSAPLYLLLGHVFILAKLGSEYWRLAMMSAVFGIGSIVLVYLIAMRVLGDNSKRRLYSGIGALVFGGSMMLVSQSIVAETYTMVTFFGLASYYFILRKQWYTASSMLALGLAVHHLILLPWIVYLLFFKEMRNWKRLAVGATGLLFYAYIPLSKLLTDQPNMWLNTTALDFLKDNYYAFLSLVGGVSIWDMPKRIFDTFGIIGVSFALGLVPLIWYVVKAKMWRQPLLWLFLLPIIYAMTNLDPHVSRYAVIGYGFGAVIVALGLSKVKPVLLYSTGIVAIGIFAFNANYFDLGRTLDPSLTAAKFYREQYPKVADGQIFMNFLPGGEWQMAFYYNKNEGRSIVPVSMGMLSNPAYQEQLRSQGVKLISNDIKNQTDNEMTVALSIVDLNPDVLITQTTSAQDYGAAIVPAKYNLQEITRYMNHKLDVSWQFKPSNPYDIVTGAIDTTAWTWVIASNWNAKFFAGFFAFGWFLSWFASGMPRRKKMAADTENIGGDHGQA